MSAAGSWRVCVVTRHFTLVLVDAGSGRLAGSMTEEGRPQPLPVTDGCEAGSAVAWKVDVPGYGETAEFKGKVAGDTMAGQVQAGLFAPAFHARRTRLAGAG
jgi:hypothetical protein